MDDLEVFFCDLCNTSVPESSLSDGTALRTKGKVIGPCCLRTLRVQLGSGGPGAARSALAAVTPTASPIGSRGGGWFIGLVVLVALAGVAVFLDWRLGDELGGVGQNLRSVEDELQQQEDRIVQLAQRVGETPVRADLTPFDTRLSELRGMITRSGEQLQASLRGAESRTDDVRDLVRAMQDSQVQQAARLALLHDELRSLGRDIAELRATPRVATPEVRHEPDEPVVDPSGDSAAADDGLPVELRHQVARLADADDGTRFEAVDELLQSNDVRVFPHLLPLAKDPDPFVRRLVFEGLADHKTTDTVEVLLTALADPEGIVRHTAYESLKKVTGESLPFDPDASSDQRSSMQRRWRQWWEKNRDSLGLATR